MFVPSVAYPVFAALINASTVLLDPYPFGGGVTTLESLSLCKPVVTLPGTQTVPHLTAGMLQAMGIESLTASDEDDFADIAYRIRSNASWASELAGRICDTNEVLYDNKAAFSEWQDFLLRIAP